MRPRGPYPYAHASTHHGRWFTPQEFLSAVAATKEHIQAGDIFQLVLSQRFERRTFATPFEIYRALRVVNPSPYMVYMQVGRKHGWEMWRAPGRRTGTWPFTLS